MKRDDNFMGYKDEYITTLYDHRGDVIKHIYEEELPVGFVSSQKDESPDEQARSH